MSGDLWSLESMSALAGHRAPEPLAEVDRGDELVSKLRPVAQAGVPAAMLDENVVRAVLWQYGLAGGREPGYFHGALMQTFQRADEDNFRILREAYPVWGFWMYALRFRTEGHALALGALRQMGARP